MRNLRGIVLLAWVLCALVSAASIIGTAFLLTVGESLGRSSRQADEVMFMMIPVVFAIPASLIISRQPRNTIGWLLMIPAVVPIVGEGINRYLTSFQNAPPPASLPIYLLAFISGSSWLGLIFPLLLIFLLFPTGRLLTPRWRWVIYLTFGMLVFFVLWGISASEWPDFGPLTLTNPIGFLLLEAEQAIMTGWTAMLAVLAVSCLASFAVRYRRAAEVEREQMKWLLYSCILFCLVYIPGLYYFPEKVPPALVGPGNLLFFLSIAAIPMSVMIAILRYHLFDIDVIIRQTLVYAVVTALLGLVYAGGIILLQAAFRQLTGQTSDLAVLVTTLAIVVLFNPLRKRVQAVIDRRFYRQKYNIDQALAEFANAARGGSDVDALTGMLVALVVKTLQPSQVNLFLKASKAEGQLKRPVDQQPEPGD